MTSVSVHSSLRFGVIYYDVSGKLGDENGARAMIARGEALGGTVKME